MTFIRNAWYVAALPDELVEGKLLARTICGDPVVFLRQEDGTASALADFCPHRFVPLSMGFIEGNRLHCPYHGLQFDMAGRCTHNPHGNGARPAALNVPAYPLVERHDLVWIWMGPRDLADEAAIPDYSCRVDPARRTIGGHTIVGCNYRLLVDNLMDLGHQQFVHRSNQQSDAFDRVRRSVIAKPGQVDNLMMFPSGSPTTLARKVLGDGVALIDMWADIRWNPVGCLLNFIGFAPAGTPQEASSNTRGTHIVTPETEHSSHYFYGVSRNFALHDPAIDDVYRAWQQQALNLEDKPIVEGVQARLSFIERLQLKPAMLACDEAAVRVSRELDRLERLERSDAPAAPADVRSLVSAI